MFFFFCLMRCCSSSSSLMRCPLPTRKVRQVHPIPRHCSQLINLSRCARCLMVLFFSFCLMRCCWSSSSSYHYYYYKIMREIYMWKIEVSAQNWNSRSPTLFFFFFKLKFERLKMTLETSRTHGHGRCSACTPSLRHCSQLINLAIKRCCLMESPYMNKGEHFHKPPLDEVTNSEPPSTSFPDEWLLLWARTCNNPFMVSCMLDPSYSMSNILYYI